MYDSSENPLEESRLDVLNLLINHRSLHLLKKFIDKKTPDIRILEIGCGSGQLGSELCHYLINSVVKYSYLGIDRDPQQIELTNKKLQNIKNAKALELDIITEFSKIQEHGTFNLIFCRWVLVHLKTSDRQKTIANSLLQLEISKGLCSNNLHLNPQSNKTLYR